jgi:tetratricopeptide (TPR) repeat protein
MKLTRSSKYAVVCLIFAGFLDHSFAQTFQQQFKELTAKKDTIGQQNLLSKWESSNSNDPELYVYYFNYFFNRSRKEVIALGNNPKGEGVFRIMDKDTSKKEPVGYMYGDVSYNFEILKKGLNYIDRGIQKFPSRLDMRFGKTYVLGLVEDWGGFTSEIVKTIEYSNVIKNEWTWTDSKPLEEPKQTLLQAIQSYVLQLYNTGDDSLLDNMRQIAETVLTYYPDHVESLSNLSIVLMIKKKYSEALVPLLKAEKLAPNDYIVLGNIAQAYKLQGDKKNAIKYYEKNLEVGNTQAKEYARKQIEELKK